MNSLSPDTTRLVRHIYAVRYFLGVDYTHHGIDCGDGYVIHYTGTIPFKWTAKIRKTTMAEFQLGDEVRVCSVANDPELVLRRAHQRLGEQKYNVFKNNCEHFATWCMTGRPYSEQGEFWTGVCLWIPDLVF